MYLGKDYFILILQKYMICVLRVGSSAELASKQVLNAEKCMNFTYLKAEHASLEPSKTFHNLAVT